MFKYCLVLDNTMINGIRSNVTHENYDSVRKLANYPPSATFDDSLTELIRKFKEMKRK